MRQLPKAIPELDGGLFLPRPVVELLEAVLLERERALVALDTPEAEIDRTIHAELRQLLRAGGLVATHLDPGEVPHHRAQVSVGAAAPLACSSELAAPAGRRASMSKAPTMAPRKIRMVAGIGGATPAKAPKNRIITAKMPSKSRPFTACCNAWAS